MICYSRYAFTNTPFGHRLALSNRRWSCGDSLTQNDRYPSYFVLIASHLTVSPVSRLTCAATSAARVLVASLVTKRPTCRFTVVSFVVDVLFLAATIVDERPLPMIGAA